MNKKVIWDQEKLRILKKDYFPGLDPSWLAYKIFGRTDYNIVQFVEKKLSELGLRLKKGYPLE